MEMLRFGVQIEFCSFARRLGKEVQPVHSSETFHFRKLKERILESVNFFYQFLTGPSSRTVKPGGVPSISVVIGTGVRNQVLRVLSAAVRDGFCILKYVLEIANRRQEDRLRVHTSINLPVGYSMPLFKGQHLTGIGADSFIITAGAADGYWYVPAQLVMVEILVKWLTTA